MSLSDRSNANLAAVAAESDLQEIEMQKDLGNFTISAMTGVVVGGAIYALTATENSSENDEKLRKATALFGGAIASESVSLFRNGMFNKRRAVETLGQSLMGSGLSISLLMLGVNPALAIVLPAVGLFAVKKGADYSISFRK